MAMTQFKNKMKQRHRPCRALPAWAASCLVPMLLLLCFAAGGHATMPNESRESPKKLIAVIPPDAPPQYFRDEKTGQAAGFSIDILNEVAVRAGNEALWDQLNTIIDAFVDSRAYQKLYQKWWGKPAPVWNTRRVAWTIAGMVAVLVAIFMVLSFRARRRANEELLANDALLRIAGETAGFGGWSVDLRSHVVAWSDTVAKIHEMPTGYSPLLKEAINFYAPEWREKITRVFSDCTESGVSYDEEMEIITRKGKRVWVRTIGEAIRDENGAIVKVQGSFQVITDRKRVEEALRKSEEKFRNLYNAMSEGMALHKLLYSAAGKAVDYEVMDVNPAYEAITGSRADQVIGRKATSLYGTADAPYLEIYADVVTTGRPAKFETRFEPMGKFFRIIVFSPAKDQFATVFEDITERKMAEEELRRRETLLQRIFEILPIGLWFADKDGRLLSGNPMGVKIWGAEPKVPISEYGVFKAWRLPSRELIEPDDWALAKTIRKGVTIVDELLEIEAFDGKRKTILNYTAPVLDDNGNIDGAIVVNLDISDRAALETQLAQAQKMESIGRLAGGVAHDFNNMLGVILGYLNFALEQVEPGQPLFAILQEIRKAAQRSADITRQLLAFARKQTIAPKSLDLNKTVEGMLNMLRRLIGEDIDLSWLPGAKLWPVKMDPSQVDQILANLCVNARDAIADVGKITIETGKVTFDEAYCADHAGLMPGDFVLLTVSDDGCGMDKQTLDNLFEPFFTTKDVNQGTGLGLATVYGIVKQNNGFVNVYSEPGRGTTFRIYLPRYETATEQISKKASGIPDARGSETILLVEDEPAILRMTTMMLERLGYAVLTASTPGEAIGMAGAHAGKIHLLITDVVMPEMNGRDLAGKLLSLYPNLKCLFMSGYTADMIAHHGVLDEGVNFIQKPFAMQDLATRVRTVLDEKK